MTIFAIGMTAILSLLSSAISSSQNAKYEIIAANLLREQIELVKNIRNTNVRNFAFWSTGITPNIYTIENDYTTAITTYNNGAITSSPVKMTPSTILPTDTLEQKFSKAQLFLDSQGRLSHTPSATGTSIASYIIITPLSFTRPHVNPSERIIEPKNADGKNQ
jgi:type II secretory pathway pseudopilin PulG